MTRTQLQAIIEDDLGYEFGQKLPLGEISSFALATDLSLQTNPEDTLFEFDTSLDLLYLWKINKADDGTIEYMSTQPCDCISFSIIEAVNMANPRTYSNYGFGHRAV